MQKLEHMMKCITNFLTWVEFYETSENCFIEFEYKMKRFDKLKIFIFTLVAIYY